jgi:hypothetical protein
MGRARFARPPHAKMGGLLGEVSLAMADGLLALLALDSWLY